MPFAAPARDLSFALDHQAGFDRLLATGAFPDCDADLVSAILEAAASFADNELAPLNREGDKHGATFENGKVRAAPGFAAAYQAFADGGWTGLSASPDFGGQGLPKALDLAAYEMFHAANMAFGLCPMLTQGAIEALFEHGSQDLKALYLPKMISGEWTGAMNLTEPQAGSDLSQIRATATPNGDGTYRLNGQKIFITWGDHDAAQNIIHLVLARLPGAPEGVRGISLFLAPKVLVEETGHLKEANSLRAGGIEHKLGIHASPTCTMLFEDATGYMVGVENRGLAHMFTMMNSARLSVGVQGVAISERALQQAREYASDRRQGKPALDHAGAGAIIDHPDVRRTLMLMQAKTEAARALCLMTAVEGDLAHVAADAQARDAARLRQDFLVPIAKAWSTDIGVENASSGVQIHGGMGFIEETGAAQHYRDARIAPIYEGTNGIQAIDLMGRKLGQPGGAEAARSLLAEARAVADALAGSSESRLHRPGQRLAAAAAAALEATEWLEAAKARSMADALAGASAYLKLMGETLGGYLLGKGALVAAQRLGEDQAYYGGKIARFRLYGEAVLAACPAAVASISVGAEDLVA